MITLGELDPDSLPTQAEVDAAPKTARDTAGILAGMPAHLRAQMLGISPATQIVAQMQNSAAMRIAADIQQSSVMRLAVEMQKAFAPVAQMVAQMQVTVAPIQQALAQMHAALAPATKVATQWSHVLEVVRALRAALPAPVATVVVDDFLRRWLIKLSALVPGHLRAQAMPRSIPPRGPMKARAPGALRMILLIDIRRGCATA